MSPGLKKALEIGSWIAGILVCILTVVLVAKELMPHKAESQTQTPSKVTDINQDAKDGATQFGQVNGNVAIYNQQQKTQDQPTKDKVFGLTGTFGKPEPPNFGPPNPPKPINFYVAGKVSVTYIPRLGDSPYLTVCFVDNLQLCTITWNPHLEPGTNEYPYKIDEPGDDVEWSKKTTDTVRACIGDAKRINDYFSMSPEHKAEREEPVCEVRNFSRPK